MYTPFGSVLRLGYLEVHALFGSVLRLGYWEVHALFGSVAWLGYLEVHAPFNSAFSLVNICLLGNLAEQSVHYLKFQYYVKHISDISIILDSTLSEISV